MSIERTTNGLSNVHLFHAVDFVIYTEGRYEENAFGTVSLDQYFWMSVTKTCAPGKKFKILSRGGKPDLMAIATEVASGNVNCTIVAMDRDYDFEIGSSVSHPRIVYTHGYSWENDVWCCSMLKDIIEELYMGEELQSSELELINTTVNTFIKNAIRVSRINLIAALSNVDYLVSTDRMKSMVILEKGKLPRFNRAGFQKCICNATVSRPFELPETLTVTETHVQGHLLAHFGYHMVCGFLNMVGQSSMINIESLSVLATNNFKSKLFGDDIARTEYYCDILTNAVR